MREILFRGKRTDNGEWVEGDLLNHDNRVGIHNQLGDGKMNVIDVDPETVGQYTGLKDSTGKRIFEGDIIKNTDMYGHSFDFIVEWDEKYSFFFAKYNGESFGECLIDLGHPKVTGNRWDNPELLEVQG